MASGSASDSIFKAYDIRGIYGKNLTEAIAEKIGRALITYLKARTMVVGHDMRPHSKPLVDALIKGMVTQGAHVYYQGLATTPMNYFANGTLGVDGSVIVTASHNPAEWNGMKMCRANAVPLSGDEGIKDIERIVQTASYAPAQPGGKVEAVDLKQQYWDKIAAYADFPGKPHIVIDYANAMGAVEMEGLTHLYQADELYKELDGSFPNHEANPLDADTLVVLGRKVRESGAIFGAAFDGDADRCGFVDETGRPISLDLVTALIAQEAIRIRKARNPDAQVTCLYDLRSSWAVKEHIAAHGGIPSMSRVGHAFIKNQMRRENACFAGELAGHFYFEENFTAESSSLALLMMTNIVTASGKRISELVAPLQRYHTSGECNTTLDAPHKGQAALDALKRAYGDKGGHMFELDGCTIEFEDWWFNVRKSNTEPKVRLIVEATTKARMEAKRDELLGLIRSV